MSFSKNVVIVTGGSSGLGAATAEAFSSEGARVVIVGRDEAKLAEVAKKCEDPLVIRADLTKDSDVSKIIDETMDKFGQIDVLINSAGTAVGKGRLIDGDVMGDYDTVMGINLRAAVNLTSLAARHLAKTKGNVVIISSVAGKTSFQPSGTLMYNVSKAALNNFTLCAAAELGPLGVRVNAVSPGPVVTDLLTNSKINASWDDYSKKTLLNKVTEPREVAGLILFLASEKAKSITGSNFVIDNGLLIKHS